MDLYLILFAIAALGVLALVLIFFGRTKPTSLKLPTSLPLSRVIEDIEEPILALEKPSHRGATLTANKNAHVDNFSDPGLASLGFSAYEGLLEPTTTVDTTLATNIKLPSNPLGNPRQKLAGKDDLVILYLMAPSNQPFVGYELLQALLAADLRYGKMNIFHRYSEENNQETILFSVASAIEPGIFDMANIGAVSCPGLSLFMSISSTQDPSAIFELILETAQQLAEDLGGTLCDSERKPITDEVLAEYKNRVLF